MANSALRHCTLTEVNMEANNMQIIPTTDDNQIKPRRSNRARNPNTRYIDNTVIQASNRGNTALQTSKSKSYTINLTKTAQKKITAARRETPIEIRRTGGGTVLTFDAATFEFLKFTLYKYYNTVKISNTKEQSNRQVEAIIQVILKSNNKTQYTMNVYLSTSRILVNGQGEMLFLERDFPKILNSLKDITNSDQLIDTNEINNAIEKALVNYISSVSHKIQGRNHYSDHQDLTTTDLEQDLCPLCNEEINNDTILCDTCGLQVHLKCENLQNTPESELFTCSICTSLRYDETTPVSGNMDNQISNVIKQRNPDKSPSKHVMKNIAATQLVVNVFNLLVS